MNAPTEPPRAVVRELFHRQQEEQLHRLRPQFPSPEDFQEALADARHVREVFLDSRANLNLDSARALASASLPGAPREAITQKAIAFLRSEDARASEAKQHFARILPSHAGALAEVYAKPSAANFNSEDSLLALRDLASRPIDVASCLARIPAVRAAEEQVFRATLSGEGVAQAEGAVLSARSAHLPAARLQAEVDKLHGLYARALDAHLTPMLHQAAVRRFDQLTPLQQRQELGSALDVHDILKSAPPERDTMVDMRRGPGSPGRNDPRFAAAAGTPFILRELHDQQRTFALWRQHQSERLEHLSQAHFQKLERVFAKTPNKVVFSRFLAEHRELARGELPNTSYDARERRALARGDIAKTSHADVLYARAFLRHLPRIETAVARGPSLRSYAQRYGCTLFPIQDKDPERFRKLEEVVVLKRGVTAAVFEDNGQRHVLDISDRKDAAHWKPGHLINRPAQPPLQPSQTRSLTR